MPKITIEVDNEIAKAYREAEPDKQQKIAMFINVPSILVVFGGA